jgi:hypothetical protein
VTDATEALRIALSRTRDRQEKVLELIKADQVAHAKRLASCGRRSVQLGCGDCGSEDNFVPISCDSPLCPDCRNKKMGRVANQYLPVVKSWDRPKHIRLGTPKRVEPEPEEIERAVGALRGAFSRLREKKVPPSSDGIESINSNGWEWELWRSALLSYGHHDLVRRWERRYVRPARHTVEDCDGCYTERHRCGDAGNRGHSVDECPNCWEERHRCEYAGIQRKGIPMSEIIRSGIYGIDLKQGDDRTVFPHMHAIVDLPYLPQAALAQMWYEVIGAHNPYINEIDQQGDSDRESALMEVIGYAAKAPEYVDVEDQVAYFEALKGSKLIQPFGELHGNTPDAGLPMYCCSCERSPDMWNYVGTVDGRYETVGVGAAPDGDRPPP